LTLGELLLEWYLVQAKQINQLWKQMVTEPAKAENSRAIKGWGDEHDLESLGSSNGRTTQGLAAGRAKQSEYRASILEIRRISVTQREHSQRLILK
jgi:hypothetical protein